jgi:peptidoglycan/xylan/chitin deacetylase (PgdA/CDA1 family)
MKMILMFSFGRSVHYQMSSKEKSGSSGKPLLRRSLGRLYFVKTPGWLKRIYPRRLWNKEREKKIIYLTFDDGPNPLVTPFVLDELKRHRAKATFFCIGKNVLEHPAIYARIQEEGHRTGNHTQHHLNGWSTSTADYLEDVAAAAKQIDSFLFRPPYGRIKKEQAKGIGKAIGTDKATIVMWDVLSGDFDLSLSKEKCLKNVVDNTSPGSIVLFHDSEKAFPRLEYVLPRVLSYFTEKGYSFEKILV